MQLLLQRFNSEHLLRALEEQVVWTLLESSETFLQGVSLLARYSQPLLGVEEALPAGHPLGRAWPHV